MKRYVRPGQDRIRAEKKKRGTSGDKPAPFVQRFILSLSFFLFLFHPALCLSGENGVHIAADTIEYVAEEETYHARGSVQITHEDAILRADSVSFSSRSADAVATGGVVYEDTAVSISADRMEVNLNTKVGTIYNSSIFYKDQNLYVRGGDLKRIGETSYVMDRAEATTCDAPEPEWRIRGRDIKVTLDESIRAKNATFYIRDLPVLFSPYFWAPLLKERQTGLLIPTLGYSSSKGYTVKQGFFWAIRENMDATFYADYFDEKGVGKGLDYRYRLSPGTGGELWMYHLRDNDRGRDFFELKSYQDQELPLDISSFLKMHVVNEFDYYRELKSTSFERIGFDSMVSNPFGYTTEERLQKYLESNLQFSRVFTGGRVYLLGQYRQSLEESSERIPQPLPEIALIVNTRSLGIASFNLSVTGTNYWRDEGQYGQRIDVYPHFFLSTGRAITFTQRIGLRETLYFLENPSQDSSREMFDLTSTLSTRLMRRYPSFVHIIEPSVEYVYIPAVDQDGIPTFDAVDSIPQTSAISYSFTNRVAGNALGGIEARLRVSNSYSLLEAEERFTPVLIETTVAGRGLALSANASYDVYDKNISEVIASVNVTRQRWFAGIGKNFRRSTDLDQYSFKAGLNGPWEVFGMSVPLSFYSKLLYDLKGGGVQELNLQTRYSRQCWGASVSFTRRPFEYQVLFAIEFRGIGEIRMGKVEGVL